MNRVTVLAHHQNLIESLLQQESWRVGDGHLPRTAVEIATHWYQGTAANGASHYREAFTDADRDHQLISALAEAIESLQQGRLDTVPDFSQKRDSICEACPVAADRCWRRSDLTVQDAITLLKERSQ